MQLVSILIPVYNEELFVREVVTELLRTIPAISGAAFEIIIVDDGSTDRTPEILAEFKDRAPLVISYQGKNFGKGAAIRRALEIAKGEFILIQDADLEYSVADYPKLLAPLLEGKADVVYGSRFLGSIEGMRFANWVFNKLICYCVFCLFGAKLSDEATAYKLMRTQLARELRIKSTRFEICPELTAKILKRGIRIFEVPIQYKARSHSEGKKIRWTDAVSALSTLLKYRFMD